MRHLFFYPTLLIKNPSVQCSTSYQHHVDLIFFLSVPILTTDRSASSNWWTIEFACVRSAAEALHFVREQRGLEANFEANSEFTDWIWVAFKHPDLNIFAMAKDRTGLAISIL